MLFIVLWFYRDSVFQLGKTDQVSFQLFFFTIMSFYLYLLDVYCTAHYSFVSKSAIQIKFILIIVISSRERNIRVDCCPGDFGENVLVGRVQTGEPQRRRQAVFITEFCWSHSVELLDFRKVHLGGH